jgi:hypothetical protein
VLNTRILAAWPNWFIVPAMLALWIFLAVLAGELFGLPAAAPPPAKG